MIPTIHQKGVHHESNTEQAILGETTKVLGAVIATQILAGNEPMYIPRVYKPKPCPPKLKRKKQLAKQARRRNKK